MSKKQDRNLSKLKEIQQGKIDLNETNLQQVQDEIEEYIIKKERPKNKLKEEF